jgi:hypothetical protein
MCTHTMQMARSGSSMCRALVLVFVLAVVLHATKVDQGTVIGIDLGTTYSWFAMLVDADVTDCVQRCCV